MKVFQQNRILAILIVLWYTGGIIGFLIPSLKSLFQQLTPVGMVLAAFILMFFHEPKNLKSALAFAGIIVITFFAELIGVNTQRLFGHYLYGPALGLQLWNTPMGDRIKLAGAHLLFIRFTEKTLPRIGIIPFWAQLS